MKALRYFRVALNSIVAHKMRAILTMLGIVIGVAAVLTTLGIGRGASADILDQIASEGITLLRIDSDAADNGEWTSGQPLTMADVKLLSDRSFHPDVIQVVPIYGTYTLLVAGSNDIYSEVVGTTTAYADIHNLELTEGRFLLEEEITQNGRVIVIGAKVAEKLFEGADAIGKSVRIRREPYTVVGVLKERGYDRFGSMDNRGIIPIGVAQDRLRSLFNAARYRGEYIVTEIHAAGLSAERVDAAERQIEQTLRLRHGLTAEEGNDFTIENYAWLLETVNSVSTTLTLFLGSIGAISLLVGGIGIMNIMLVSVTERTREIGLRKALGAQNGDILLQFLIEAVVLTVVGGLFGIAISFGLALLVESVSSPDFPLAVIIKPDSVIIAFSVSAACGLLFGLYPAIRATRLDPIEALRFE